MKECILETNLKGQGWYSSLFTILLILTWELRYPQKEGLTEEEEEVLEVALPGRGTNDLTWGRKGLSGDQG